MKSKFLRVITAGVLLTLSGTINIANAEYMVDTGNDSFIDTSTGLEWMDFGINNNQSYNYVSSQLGLGGTYESWRLATADEVYAMWTTAFISDENQWMDLNYFGDGQFYTYDYRGIEGNLWDVNSDVMGYNWNITGNDKQSRGWFEDSSGNFTYVYVNNTSHPNYHDKAHLGGEVVGSDDVNQYSSTLLVKDIMVDEVVDVNEPATLAIFALGIIGLRIRRFKKQEFTRFTG